MDLIAKIKSSYPNERMGFNFNNSKIWTGMKLSMDKMVRNGKNRNFFITSNQAC